MRESKSARPSPALIVAVGALVLAMSGAAIALPGQDTVTSGDIQEDAVKSDDLDRNAVRSKEIKPRAVRGSDVQNDALKGRQVLEEKLEAVPEARSVRTVSPFGGAVTRVVATEASSLGAAQAAAPRTELATVGQLTVYGKCFRAGPAAEIHGQVYIETAAGGAVFTAAAGELSGSAPGGYLDVGTAEGSRILLDVSVTGPGAAVETGDFYAMAPDGTGLGGPVAIAVKHGTLPAGDGIYGEGNVCLFAGHAVG